MKAAMTLDGKIATAAGESQWITGESARLETHRLRRRVDAVMVGIGTILKDDPQLTARMSSKQSSRATGRQPIRVVVDSRLRIPLNAKVALPSSSSRTIIVTTKLAPTHRIKALRARGITILTVPVYQGRVSLESCLTALGKMEIISIMLEGGSELNASALRAGLVNRVRFYIAPMLLGGWDAKGVVGGRSPKQLVDALALEDMTIKRVGQDLVLEARIHS